MKLNDKELIELQRNMRHLSKNSDLIIISKIYGKLRKRVRNSSIKN